MAASRGFCGGRFAVGPRPWKFISGQKGPLGEAMKLLAVIAILLTSPAVLACDLSLVAPAKSVLRNPVQARAALAGDILSVSYSVSTPSLNAAKDFDAHQFPYMFDVVELFVTFSETGFPYYEFEVSPYNQTFQVKITEHHRFQEAIDLGLVSTATIVRGGWIAELKIPLKSLGWDGDPQKIRGNFYAILQRAPNRSFWSSFLPKAEKAKFHQPQFFQPLLRCE
jgi:Carbohydrate family 9 binding domain-like